MNTNRGGARAFDPRAHLVEEHRQVGDFRLQGTVLHQGFAFGERCRHHEIFRAGYGDLLEDDVPAAQPFCRSFNVTVLLGDGRAQLLQTFDVQIDGTRADGASAGKGNPSSLHTRDQRSQNQGGGTHGLDQLVRGFGVDQVATAECGAVVSAPVTQLHFRSHGTSRLRSVCISRTSGMFSRTTGSSVRMAAAIAGSAAFFAPLTRIVPTRGLPPRTTNLSITLSDAVFLFSPQTGRKGIEIFVYNLRERSTISPYRATSAGSPHAPGFQSILGHVFSTAFRTFPLTALSFFSACLRSPAPFSMMSATATWLLAACSALAAVVRSTPAACSRMPSPRSTNFSFLVCTFTIRLP